MRFWFIALFLAVQTPAVQEPQTPELESIPTVEASLGCFPNPKAMIKSFQRRRDELQVATFFGFNYMGLPGHREPYSAVWVAEYKRSPYYTLMFRKTPCADKPGEEEYFVTQFYPTYGGNGPVLKQPPEN